MSSKDSLLEDAEEQLMISIQQDSNNVLAWYLLGTLKAEYNSTGSALHCFNEALSIDPGFQPAQLEAARLYRDEEAYDNALDGFRMIMTSGSCAGLLALADCVLLMENMGESDSLERALQMSNSEYFSIDLARIFLDLNEYERAISISLNILVNAAADSADVLEILGTAYYGNNEINRAEETFLALLEKDPLSLSVLLYLGDIAEREARIEDAVDYYLGILEQDPYNSEARSRLRIIAGDSYNVESTTGTMQGFSAATSADLSIERGNRAMFEWGGSASASYRFDRRGTSIDATLGGRSVTWEENYGIRRDTLNTNRGWARLGFDYWLNDSYFIETSLSWDRQMYTERPWQISSYCAAGWQKWILSWFWFSPKLGLGSVNTRWTSGAGETYVNDFSVFAFAGLRYSKPYTFIREAELSGDVYFPPDNPENFISRGSISMAFRTWSPLYVRIGYNVDYTRVPEISTWKKFNTSFTTSINFDLF